MSVPRQITCGSLFVPLALAVALLGGCARSSLHHAAAPAISVSATAAVSGAWSPSRTPSSGPIPRYEVLNSLRFDPNGVLSRGSASGGAAGETTGTWSTASSDSIDTTLHATSARFRFLRAGNRLKLELLSGTSWLTSGQNDPTDSLTFDRQ